MTSRWRQVPPLVWAHVTVGVAAVVLAFVPLFDLLGFEFAAAIGFVLAYVTGWRACAVAAAARADSHTNVPSPFPGRALLRCAAENLTLLVTPIALMALNSRRVPTCNWSAGIEFYLLFPVPAVLYGTALGFLLGLAWPARRARLAFVLWSVLTYAWAIGYVLAQPPKFVYNSFIGFFPGPVYDAEVPIQGTLVLARAIVVMQALLCVLLGALAWDGRRARARRLLRDWHGERAISAAAALVLVVTLAILACYAAPLGLRIDRGYIQRTLGGHIETAHCHIYYDRASVPAARAAEMAAEHEFRFAQLQRFFDLAPRRKFGSYVYASAAQKKRLMGAAGTSFEDALHDEFHINAADDPHPVLTHEMAHIFAAQIDRWKPVNLKMGIHEGIAVAAEWNEESGRMGLTPHQACAAMDSLHLLPDLRSALGAFGFWTQPGARAYTAAGSFVRYLLDTYGMPRFRVLWRRGDFDRAYGKTLAALLADWHAMLRQVTLTPADMRRAERLYRHPAIFAQPCAHELARLETRAAGLLATGRATEAESVYVQLRDIEPEDASHGLDLGWARLRARRFEAARQLASEILESQNVSAAQRDQAWRLAGDAAWQLGKVAEAESCYAAGLASSAYASERRAYEVALATLHDPELAPRLRDYLTEIGLPESAGLALLAETRVARPEASLPRYLLGRRLFFAERFEACLPELRAALADSQLVPQARRAALELAGRAALRAGRPEEALAAFGSLLGLDLDTAERLRLEDWKSRAEWTLRQQEGAAPEPRAG